MGRNLCTGGSAVINGSAHIGRDLRVDGWLDAPNVKRDSKGLFLTPEALTETYPHPEPGWWAMVGTSLPADLYTESDGVWAATGGQGGQLTADLPSVSGLAEQFAAQITRCEEALTGLESVADTADEARETADEAMLAARGTGIVPFDGFHESGPRPRRGVWYVPASGSGEAHFAYVSSDWGYGENDYNEPDATDGESPVRTDCLFRHGTGLWYFDGQSLHQLADRPVEIAAGGDSLQQAAAIAPAAMVPGRLYCAVDPATRRVTSIWLG